MWTSRGTYVGSIRVNGCFVSGSSPSHAVEPSARAGERVQTPLPRLDAGAGESPLAQAVRPVDDIARARADLRACARTIIVCEPNSCVRSVVLCFASSRDLKVVVILYVVGARMKDFRFHPGTCRVRGQLIWPQSVDVCWPAENNLSVSCLLLFSFLFLRCNILIIW